ncbi:MULTISPECIES: histidine phosphatase family protein [Tsukamurella]|uniref:Histidine phosphatase family protein n=1 Tax=Tsukamurella strandjordii TaxID=147577 RepID=A0AA90NEH2_9ACTN|nr:MULTISPECIES: histidine phosphatase family protein [Tsukamurella]MDP0396986.1 histidine phosphatase family protein [Tsukamurella strandjordii]GIZ96788.1 phosphoglycerate mutase [Tsukamurella sp. TY48]
MTELVLVRHARTAANEADLLQGRRSDGPVLAGALTGPDWVGRGLPVPDAYYSSPQLRAQQTAVHLFPGRVFHVDERLAERDLGDLDGMAAEALRSDHPDLAARLAGDARFVPPAGESALEVAARFRSFLRDLPAGVDTVGCVTHGALIAIVLRLLAGTRERSRIRNLEAVRLRLVAPDAVVPVQLVTADEQVVRA